MKKNEIPYISCAIPIKSEIPHITQAILVTKKREKRILHVPFSLPKLFLFTSVFLLGAVHHENQLCELIILQSFISLVLKFRYSFLELRRHTFQSHSGMSYFIHSRFLRLRYFFYAVNMNHRIV